MDGFYRPSGLPYFSNSEVAVEQGLRSERSIASGVVIGQRWLVAATAARVRQSKRPPSFLSLFQCFVQCCYSYSSIYTMQNLLVRCARTNRLADLP